MKKVLKRSLSLLLAITIIFGSAYVGLSEVDFGSINFTNPFAIKAKAAASGITGDCTWTLDGTVLTISGNGKMGNHSYYSSAYLPWGDLITKIIIEDGVTSIGEDAFNGCKSLESVDIPNSVISIGYRSFNGCKSLESVDIPDSVTNIDYRAFSYCRSLIYITIPGSVTSIGDYAFDNCAGLTSVIISNGVISIGVSAFTDCTRITSITIPDSVTSIGDYAFSGCTSLKSIIIPDSVTSIGYSAFEDCVSITSVSIGNGITSIGADAFSNCTKLTSINISDSVKSIGRDVFYGTAYYNDPANWKNGELYIGNCLIKAKTSISGDYVIRDGTKAIAGEAFYNCSKLTSIVIPNGITRILDCTFGGCDSLKSISLPASLEDMSGEAFYDPMGPSVCPIENIYITDIASWCNGDWSFEIEYDNLYLNGVNVKNLSEIEITGNAKKIGDYAFYGFENIKSVIISDSVTSIGECAFANCESLTSITIPESVTSIGECAFEGCVNLKSIKIPQNVEKLDSYSVGYTVEDEYKFDMEMFSDRIDDIKIYGAKGSTAEYYARENGITFIVDEHKHTPGNWVIDVVATCKENGKKHKSCNECGEIARIEIIPATGKHTASGWIVDKQATASAVGTKYKKCTVCGTKLETATIPMLKPATPKVTSTNAIGGVQLNWNKVSGAVKYNVYRRSAGEKNYTYLGTTTGNTYLDKTVKNGQYYCYTVRAFNSAGGYSDYIYANTSTRKYMATPKLTTIYNHVNGLAIKWNAVAGVTNGYRVYRRGAGQTTWTYLGTVKTTYFTDTSVKYRSGEYFRYTVIADGGYHSKFDATGLYLKRLENPTLKSATSSSSGITVKWETVVGTTGYYVYRKTANSGWTRIATVSGTNNTSYLDKTAKKGITYTYTVRAVYGSTLSAYYSGVSCKDKY